MDWFQSKTGQLIALATIVSTLAGFGYTCATYVNRIENLEAKIGGVDEAEDEMKIIEERFASIETSVQFLEKEIDNIGEKIKTEVEKDQNEALLQSLSSFQWSLRKVFLKKYLTICLSQNHV